MRNLVIFVCFAISWAEAQNGRSSQHTNGQYDNGHGWDIRLAVPGEPGSDYPTLSTIPRTSFTCAGKDPGYYADIETNCQVFRVCTAGSTYGFQSFLCPNGTLFNQAVFVCDWWMNVNCQRSQLLFNNNNEKFGNLKLGPQLMKDVKKMLTHPMRNPLDKTAMKSNLVVMQNYKPPSGQLFPNGALIAGPERTPNNVYIPAKQIQQNFAQNSYNDNSFTASTLSPTYIPVDNTIQQPTQDTEVFQRQRQNSQYVQSNRNQNTQNVQSGNIISNGHAGRLIQSKNTPLLNNNGFSQVIRPTQNYNQGNVQYSQKQISNPGTTLSFNSQNTINTQRDQIRQKVQFTSNIIPSQQNAKQSEFENEYAKQQYNYNSNQDKQPYTYKTPIPQFANEIGGKVSNEAKQNLVSSTVPSTVAARALNFNRIVQEVKRNPNAKSRITFKTWIVKPSKAARLIAEPTPYTYNSPTKSIAAKLIQDTTPYLTRKMTLSQSAKIISEPEPTPYIYSQPTTIAAKQIETTVREPQSLYLAPTNPTRSIFSDRLKSTAFVQPTKASLLYIAPTTYKPNARLYVPPSDNPVVLSRQYLSPVVVPSYYESAQLRIAPTTSSTVFTTPSNEIENNVSFTDTKQSNTKINNGNLTFADILTREKLDITVSDIVKDTSNILNTASPEKFGQLRQEIQSDDYYDDNFLPPERNTDIGEKLTPQTPTVASQSSQLIKQPSTDLEPPVENDYNGYNNNPLANLPFFKEPALNTIERTVSLKITIPEKIASYLLKSCKESEYDRLEILNTGSSNYLVLANKANKSTNPSFIPIGKLIFDKKSNISHSQAFVFSFLADSINEAKGYSSIAQENVLTSTTAQPQFQNINSAELAQITNQISQLTSSQYSENDQNSPTNTANIMSIAPPITNATEQHGQTAKYENNSQNQVQQTHSMQYNVAPTQQLTQNQFRTQSSRFQSGTNNQNANHLSNENTIYSGQLYQLPVPDVTSQIYNTQSPAKLVQSTENLQNNLEAEELQRGSNQNKVINTNSVKQSSAEVEIVQSQSLPISHPARLQVAPSIESNSYNNQENSAQVLGNLLNTNNGITAQLQDKIVGTIKHPTDNNKIVTYKKDQSYYLFTKYDNEALKQNIQANIVRQPNNNFGGGLNAKLIQSNNLDNRISFQFIPSVRYQLEDEKDQQRILNTFQINEFGTPKALSSKNNGYHIPNPNDRQDIVTNVNYSVDHSANQVDDQNNNNLGYLYAGPSSYSAPQSSVGHLRKVSIENNLNSRLEKFDDFNGYSKVTPARQFTY